MRLWAGAGRGGRALGCVACGCPRGVGRRKTRAPNPLPRRRRFLLWGGAIAGFMWAPASALEGFSQAARVFSGIFILVQVCRCGGWTGAACPATGWVQGAACRQTIASLTFTRCRHHIDCHAQLLILLDFIYAVNEWLVERRGAAHAALVAGSALLILGSFVAIGFMYHFYAPYASCSTNIGFLTRWAGRGCCSAAGATAGGGGAGPAQRQGAPLPPPARRAPERPSTAASPPSHKPCLRSAVLYGGADDGGAFAQTLSLPCTQRLPRPLHSIILFFLLYGGISVSPLRNESAGLFTSACVFAYSTYCEEGGRGGHGRHGGTGGERLQGRGAVQGPMAGAAAPAAATARLAAARAAAAGLARQPRRRWRTRAPTMCAARRARRLPQTAGAR